MRGILSYGGYVPYRRLTLGEIGETFSGGGRGTRSVASFDQDTTTLGVEAGRLAMAGLQDDAAPATLWFSTTEPAYADKTNATTIHAALRLDASVPAIDMVGSVRSASGALLGALCGIGPAMVVTADMRTGLPTSADEATGGDGAAAVVIGDDTDGTLIAEYLGSGSATEEFVDRWRVPGEKRSRLWEDRFGEVSYVPLAVDAWNRALAAADIDADAVDTLVISGTHARAVSKAAGTLAAGDTAVVDHLTGTIGNTGAAQGLLGLSSVLDTAEPGQIIAVATLSDGADVVLFRVTDALAERRSSWPLAAQIENGASVKYGKYLTWRGMVDIEPPRRPSPDRPSSTAAARGGDWKYGFVGTEDRSSGAVHMPPSRVSFEGGALDDMADRPMADVQGTVVTYTVDAMMYSPSPPTMFAVVDFDGGGRTPVELTDVDPDDLEVGTRIEMTFRKLFSSDGIHNYFWKGRPVRR